MTIRQTTLAAAFDGFRVVAALAKKDEDAVPVRVVRARPRPKPTPHEAGTPPDAVEIIRRVDTVLVHKVAAVAAALTN